MRARNTQPWFSARTRNVLAAILVCLALVAAGLVVWRSLAPSGIEQAAEEVAVAFASLDHRDRAGWTDRVRELCTEEGWAFWNQSLQQGMWEQVEAKELVTDEVQAREATILETWDDDTVLVQVSVHAEGRSKDEPFSQDYEYTFLMVPEGKGRWRFAGLMPIKAVR